MTTDCILIGIDLSHGIDAGILIVGRQTNNKIDIVNTFQGDEAYELYNKLVTRKENKNAEN